MPENFFKPRTKRDILIQELAIAVTRNLGMQSIHLEMGKQTAEDFFKLRTACGVNGLVVDPKDAEEIIRRTLEQV